jgi:hypothetical protein
MMKTKHAGRVAASSAGRRTPTRQRAVAGLTALALTLGSAAALAAAAEPQSGARAKPSAEMPAAGKDRPRAAGSGGGFARYFSEDEREAWRKKIAAAGDDTERRRLRGQQLAEMQRRARAEKAQAGGRNPADAPKPAQRRAESAPSPQMQGASPMPR